MVTLLIKNRAALTDDYGASPLNIAIEDEASLDIVKAIVAQGARLSVVDSKGCTPLRIAVDKKNWELASYLSENGSDIFSVAGDRKTPADIALAGGDEAVRALFGNNRGIGALDPSGNTILHYAARTGSQAMVNLLLTLGADKNVKNIAAESPSDVA
jgi:ankyrin repeat protein